MQRAYADPGTPGSPCARRREPGTARTTCPGPVQNASPAAGRVARRRARNSRGCSAWDRMAAMLRRPYVVGIAGGTGSGKTTVADKLAGAMPPGRCVTIDHDAYYRDQGH